MGFSESKVRLDKLPGWEANSWAYHGDDGLSFNQTASGKTFGPKFGSHDVIGCGVNFRYGQVFYTKNGNYIGNCARCFLSLRVLTGCHLGIAFRDVKSDTLYPSVGMKKASEHVKANFGQTSFVYDIDGHVAVSFILMMALLAELTLRSEKRHHYEMILTRHHYRSNRSVMEQRLVCYRRSLHNT